MSNEVHAVRSGALALCLGLCVSGCMLTPTEDQELTSTTDPVEFTGYVPTPGMQVTLEAAPSGSGPFSTWPGSSVSADWLPTRFVGGVPYYRWSYDGPVPDAYWQSVSGGSETYVRPIGGFVEFTTFDDAGIDCLLTEIDAPGFHGLYAMRRALHDCGSAQSPVVRLSAPATSGSTYVGDVIVTTQGEADALAGYQVVDGNLSVVPPSATTLSLPDLVEVTGDLVLSLPADGDLSGTGGPYSEPRCGGSTGPWFSNITRVAMPLLSQVGGSLSVDVPMPGVPVGTTPGEDIEVGLDALVSVGGDVSLGIDVPATGPCGLGSLTSVGGNLEVVYGGADVAAQELLQAVTTVGGDVSVGNIFSLVGVPLPSLQSAAHVSFGPITGGLAPSALVPVLSSATGLTLIDTNLGSLAQVGPSNLAIDLLELNGNSGLAALPSGVVQMNPGASLVIGPGNTALGAAEVCSFVDDQVTSHGWTPAGSGFSCP